MPSAWRNCRNASCEAVLLMSEGRSKREIGVEMGFTVPIRAILVSNGLREAPQHVCGVVASRRPATCCFGEPTSKSAEVPDGRIAEAA
jgi:hypothetical protein